MEDPITFDLWGEPVANHRTQALDFLSSARPQLSRIDMLREYVAAVNTRRPMLIAERLDWPSVMALRVRVAIAFDGGATYQSGLAPGSSGLRECLIHLGADPGLPRIA